VPTAPSQPPHEQTFLLGGRLKLLQGMTGHRVGTDAVLLAACTNPAARTILDVGAGVGGVGLAAALHAPGAGVTLVEREPSLVHLADANISQNGLAHRVRAVTLDCFASAHTWASSGIPADSQDQILTNPPYMEAGRGRVSPDALRQSAHVLDGGTLGEWVHACMRATRPGGTVVVIYRADSFPALLEAMRPLGALTLLPVHARDDGDATRVIVCGVKASRAPGRLLAPLILHRADGAFTEAAQALQKAQARLQLLASGPALVPID
jgi:tRNA1(Val) A37 N6-methylase TrmN6